MKSIQIYVAIAFLPLILTSCGGGGGSGAGNANTPVAPPSCVTSQAVGCIFSATDTAQSAVGWWQGQRNLISPASSINAYLIATSNSYAMYLGDNFQDGSVTGTLQVSGSAFSSFTGTGFDAAIPTTGGVNISGGTGGVVTKKLFFLGNAVYTAAASANLTFNYNPAGDQLLSSYAGNYSNGTGATLSTGTTLAIQSNGTITFSYPDTISPSFGVYTNLQCVDNITVAPTTPMSQVSWTASAANNCGSVDTVYFYSFQLAGKTQIAVLGKIGTYQGTVGQPWVLQ